jgi:hypothetical protein
MDLLLASVLGNLFEHLAETNSDSHMVLKRNSFQMNDPMLDGADCSFSSIFDIKFGEEGF